MVRSVVCWLSKMEHSKEFTSAGECEFDEGGYFIIHGTEKVLIAQEKTRFDAVVFLPPPRLLSTPVL